MTKPHNLHIMSAIFLITFIFLCLTGTLTSGFHFTDDHEILSITNALTTKPLIDVVKNYIALDLSARFRPMYYVHRVIECLVFKDNFLLWSIYNALLASTIFTLFFMGMRKLRYSIVESLIFLVIAFIGTQMAMWWRLGPNEPIGLLFLSFSFYLATRTPFRHGHVNTLFFSIFLIFSSWSKESFTITVPAFVFLKVWLYSIGSGVSITESIKRNWLLALPLLVMIGNIVTIVFIVGTQKTGYAGVDSSLLATIVGILKIALSEFKMLTALLLFMLIVLYRQCGGAKHFLSLLSRFIPVTVFAVLTFVPNCILHAKSGMPERYMLPAILGLALLLAHVVRESRGSRRSYVAFLVCVCVFGLSQLWLATRAAMAFAKEGHETREFLSSLSRNVSTEKTKVLLIADPVYSFEWTISLSTYLLTTKGCPLYVLGLSKNTSNVTASEGWYSRLHGRGARIIKEWQSQFSKDSGLLEEKLASEWNSRFSGRKFADITGPPDLIVFLDAGLVDRASAESKLGLERYRDLFDRNFRFAVLVRR